MRKRLAVAAIVGLLLGGACGDGDGDENAIDGMTSYEVVVGATTATLAENTSKFTFDLTIAGVGDAASSPATVNVTGTGAFDYDAHEGTMKVTIPAGSSTTTLDSVVMGTVVYQKVPPALLGPTSGTGTGTGKPWIKIDFAALGSFAGINLGTLASAQSSDPSQAVALLRGASTEVVEIGDEKLRGDDVTHYRFSIDPGKAAAAAPEELRESLERFDGLFGGTTVPADAWVDDSGRLRKLTYTLSGANFAFLTGAPASEDAANAKLTSTVELFDFGVDVDAKPPPPDQVTDFNEFLRGDAD